MSNETYSSAPGDSRTAGQLRTASSPVRPEGKPADNIIMPSDEETTAQRGPSVPIGDLVIRPDSGYFLGRYIVTTKDGGTLKGDAALAAVYEEARRLSEELR